MKNNLLLIEDDFTLGYVIKGYLTDLGYHTLWAQNASAAFKLFNPERVALCLVDIGLPDKDGFEIVREMKALSKQVPVLFLTARNQIDDKIKAYEIGADDYLCKPFEMKELELRIQALKRRFNFSYEASLLPEQIDIGGFRFNPAIRRLKSSSGTTKLSHIDCELLKLLYQNRNHYIKSEQIIQMIWGNNDESTQKRLSVYINRIRTIFKNNSLVHIENVYGQGYKLQVETEIPNP